MRRTTFSESVRDRVHEPGWHMIGGLMCFGLIVVFFVTLLVGSVVLRAAVSFANRVVGPPKPKADPFEDWDWDDEPEEELPRRSGKEKTIPEPGYGKGMMIASTVTVLTVFIAFVLAVVTEAIGDELFEGENELRAVAFALLTFPLAFIGMTVLLIPMLPTTIWRAALVAFLYHLIGVGLMLIVGGAITAAWYAVGP